MSIIDIIKKSESEDHKELDLSFLTLTNLPAEIGSLTNLKSLDLSYNSLEELPVEIEKCINLKCLIIDDNDICSLSLNSLSNLETLQIGTNYLTSFPSVSGCRNLKNIDCYTNSLRVIPPELGLLTNLQSLNFWTNALVKISPEISKCSNLTTLILQNNQLESLPVEIYSLINLECLDVGHNKLTSISSNISHLSKLHHLGINWNFLEEIPSSIGNCSELRCLDIMGNKIKILPSEISFLPHLKTFWWFGNNSLIYPPQSVLQKFDPTKGDKTILEWMKNNEDIYSRKGRRKNMWKKIKLIYIAHKDDHCIDNFGKLPLEIIHYIDYLIISEPYIKT